MGPCVLDLDHLPAAVGTAVRTHVVRTLEAAAVAAAHELWSGEVMMPAAVTLPMAADFLLWQCAHLLYSLSSGARRPGVVGMVVMAG